MSSVDDDLDPPSLSSKTGRKEPRPATAPSIGPGTYSLAIRKTDAVIPEKHKRRKETVIKEVGNPVILS